MTHEIGQLDILDRNLLESSSSKAIEWTEIGEATVTHTIFGNAQVRINRQNDKTGRVRSLLVFTVVVVALLIGWIVFQRADSDKVPPSAAIVSPSALAVETVSPSKAPAQTVISPQPAKPPTDNSSRNKAGKAPLVPPSAKRIGAKEVVPSHAIQAGASVSAAPLVNKTEVSPTQPAGEN